MGRHLPLSAGSNAHKEGIPMDTLDWHYVDPNFVPNEPIACDNPF